jgi:hypothetical protein
MRAAGLCFFKIAREEGIEGKRVEKEEGLE